MTVSVVTLVCLFLLAGALVLLIVAAVAWSRRHRAPQAAIASLLMVSAAIYAFGYAGEVVQTSLAGAMFWLHVEYLGLPWIPALWVLMALRHNGLRSHLGLLLVIPLITLVAQWSNSFHGLFDRSLMFISRPPFWIVSPHRGPVAWLFIAYMYAALLYGTWLYISRFRISSHLYRKQNLILVTACLPPLCGNLVYLCDWSPWGLDLAPAMLGITVILAYFAVIKLECFDLVPMARSLVFNSIRDAALVTDLQHCLVDFNPAARELLPCLGNIGLGADVTTTAFQTPALQQIFHDPNHQQEIELDVGGELQHFAARVLPLRLEERQAGWAIILANITAQVRLVHELRRDAETDELTGVANRRRFAASIERESERSRRNGTAFSVIILDIDRFKDINDRFGHGAGDSVLAAIANRIVSCLRRVDLLSRYGGDEFAVLLPEAGSDGAFEAAERIRAAVAGSAVEMVEGQLLYVSISVGLATHDQEHSTDWEQLLAEADQALYCAKADGRNRLARWKGLSSSAAENEIVE
jgi:diguanylate cyclase (GGDEF)-like protein